MSNTNPLQLLRSSTANKRPLAAGLVDGRPAINTNSASPGLFFKDSTGGLVKVGPVHVGTTAPNVSPASGGATGNSVGEQWLDTTGGTYVLKIWDGSAWRSESGTFVDVNGDVMTGALVMDNQQQVRFRETTANGTNYIALQAPASVASDKTITLPDVNGTVVTTGDTGTVTSTMILDGTIVNADVNASAAIAGTKISPDFGSQNVTTTGTNTAASFIPTSSTVPTSGVYLPAANSVAISTGGTGRLFVDASGRVGINSAPSLWLLEVKQDSASSAGGAYPVIQVNNPNANGYAGVYLNDSTAQAGLETQRNTGHLGLQAGGSERLRITSAGLVGIGTSSPSTLLTVQGDATLRVASGNVGIGLQTGSLNGSWYLNDADDSLRWYSSTGGDRLTISSSGNVGIGTTSPTQRLQITDGSLSNFYVAPGYNSGQGTLLATGGSEYLAFATNGLANERLRITSAGLVGIGTSAPNYQLHVTTDFAVGASGFNQQLTFSNDTIQSLLLGTGYTALKLNPLGGNVGIGTSSPSHALTVNGAISSLTGVIRAEQGANAGFVIGSRSAQTDFQLYNTGNVLRFYNGSSDALSIDTSGRVGIGTTGAGSYSTYGNKLVIYGTGTNGPGMTIATGTSDTGSIYFADGTTGNEVARGAVQYAHADDALLFQTAASERLRITSAGLVGIGTSSPSSKLDVRDASVSQITSSVNGVQTAVLGSDTSTGAYTGTLDNYPYKFLVNGSVKATLTSTGLGIGTTSPSYRLTVDNINESVAGISLNGNDQSNARIRIANGGASGRNWELTAGLTGANNSFFSIYDQTATSSRLVIDDQGRVGIGTASPSGLLNLSASNAAGYVSQVLDNTNATGYVNQVFRIGSTGASGQAEINYAPGTFFAIGPVANDTTTPIVFRNNNATERARIDSSGRLLVGTSSWTGSSGQTGGIEIISSNYVAAGQVTERLGSWRATANDNNGTAQVGIDYYRMPRGGGVQSGVEMRFYTGYTYLGGTYQRMTLDQDGRLGIGTSSPDEKLHVSGGNIKQQLAAATNGGLSVNNGTNDVVAIGTGGFAANGGSVTDGGIRATNSLVFATGSGTPERARIDSSGRLLVGTSTARANYFNSTATTQLQIEKAGGGGGVSVISDSVGDDPAILILGKSNNASVGGNTAVAVDNFLGTVSFQGNDGSEFVDAARISCYVDGTPGANDMPGRLVFSTTADGASSPTEACRINSSQQLLVNTNASIASFNDGRIEVASKASQLAIAADATASSAIGIGIRGNTSTTAISFFNASDGATCGTIVLNSGSTSYNTSSDYRLKENVTAVTDGITRLQQLKPSRFNFIADPDKTVDGFIAHEVQTIVPEAITGEKDAVDDEGNPQYQGIDQSKMVPLVVAALQEAITKIETLEARLTAAGL